MCNFISTRNTQWECKAAILVVVRSDDKFARRPMCEYLEWHSTWHVAMIPRRIPQLDLLDCVNVLIAITIVSFEWRQQESFWTTISTARFSDDISLKIELDCVSICVTKFRIHHRCQRLSTRVAKLIIDIVNASIDIMIKVIATWWRIGRWSIRNCCRDMWIELDIDNYFGTFFLLFSPNGRLSWSFTFNNPIVIRFTCKVEEISLDIEHQIEHEETHKRWLIDNFLAAAHVRWWWIFIFRRRWFECKIYVLVVIKVGCCCVKVEI